LSSDGIAGGLLPNINDTTSQNGNHDNFLNELQENGNVWQELYSKSRAIITQVCDEVLPSAGRVNDKDWYARNKKYVRTILAKQHNAWSVYEQSKRLNLHKSAKGNWNVQKCWDNFVKQKEIVRSECRRLRRSFWTELAGEMQNSFDKNDVGLYFSQLKKKLGSVGRTARKSGAVEAELELLNEDKETYSVTRAERLKRWVQHFKKILNLEGTVGDDLEKYLPIQKEVDFGLDEPFTSAELDVAIAQLSNGKATGTDGIPIELERYSMGDHLRSITLAAFNGALMTGEVLSEFKDVSISVLFKKGNRKDCDHYRGISIINHDGKLLERLIQNRLLPFVQETGCIPETQCGFLPGRSTVDAVLVSRLVSTFALEKDVPLFKCFIDLTKAYDKVDRSTLWRILERIGVSPRLLKVIVNLHEGAKARVKLEGEMSEEFELRRGLKQGSVFAPLLFNIFFGAIINAFHKECEEQQEETGIVLGLKFDGNWSNNFVMNSFVQQRQRQNQRARGNNNEAFSFRLLEILFADDCEIFAESEEALQLMMNIFAKVARIFAQEVADKKTKIIVVAKWSPGTEKIVPVVTANGKLLEVVDVFVYLGSKESSSGNMDAEVSVRKQRMYAAFNEWSSRILLNPCLSQRLKLTFFNLIVISNGLYGCATWNLCATHIQKLDSVQYQLLRLMFRIKYDARVSYEKVLGMAERAGYVILPLECRIAKLQLRYLGHVERMGNSRIQKQILYSCLNIAGGKKNKRGAPARNYRLVIVDALTKFGYSPQNWRELAADRSSWRHYLNSDGQDLCWQKWLDKRAAQRSLRQERDDDVADAGVVVIDGIVDEERIRRAESQPNTDIAAVVDRSSAVVSSSGEERCRVVNAVIATDAVVDNIAPSSAPGIPSSGSLISILLAAAESRRKHLLRAVNRRDRVFL
jgi:hypothetical protein